MEQLRFMDEYADLREDRASEILCQMGMQTAFWTTIANLRPDRTRFTLELLNVALQLAIVVEMRFKHALACPRPVEFSSQVQPMIQTPGHGSLPSGHSTQAYMIALVLYEILPAGRKNALLKEQLLRQADRVAINRTVAGVHFPIDTAAGHVLGTTLAEYFVHRCVGVTSKFKPRRFDGTTFDGDQDYNPREALDKSDPLNPPPAHIEVSNDASVGTEPSPLLSWLWTKASKEWDPVD
jgi:hypothetical protein